MTTSQPAHEVPHPLVPGRVDAPDGETLARVLDGLRDLDLPRRPAAHATQGPAGTADAPAVPLPRRRSERRAPSVD